MMRLMVDLDADRRADRRADRKQDAGHLELAEIGLVAEDVPAMVRFYDDFFGAGLRPAPLGGATVLDPDGNNIVLTQR